MTLRCGPSSIPGDEVIYHEPCFVAYAPCIQLAGGVPVGLSAPRTRRASRSPLRRSRRPSRRAPRRSSWATRTTRPARCSEPRAARCDRRRGGAARPAGHHRRDLRPAVYGGHAHTAFSALPGMRERTVLIGGVQQDLCDDRLADRLRRGAGAALMAGIAKVHQYGIMCAPTPAQFAAHRGAAHRRAVRRVHARRVRPPPAAHDLAPEPDGAALLRAARRVLLLPQRDRCHRPGRRDLRPAPPCRGARGGRPRHRPSARQAPGTCGRATRPPTRRSSRRWTAWSGSSPAAGKAGRQVVTGGDIGPRRRPAQMLSRWQGPQGAHLRENSRTRPREPLRLLQVDHVGHSLEDLEPRVGMSVASLRRAAHGAALVQVANHDQRWHRDLSEPPAAGGSSGTAVSSSSS